MANPAVLVDPELRMVAKSRCTAAALRIGATVKIMNVKSNLFLMIAPQGCYQSNGKEGKLVSPSGVSVRRACVHARFAFLGAVLLAAILAACGGGGGGGGTPATIAPTPTPCPSPAGGGVGFCGTGYSSQVPAAAGASYSATMNFGTGSGTATIAATVAAPTPVATISAQGVRSSAKSGSTVHAADTAPYNAIVYLTLTATTNVSLSSVPTITVTSPSGAAGAYYVEQTFWVTLPQSGAFTLAAGSSAYFAIYTGGTLPSPNPYGCVGVQADAATRTGAHAALVGVQPITSGATFSYTGTLTQTISRASPCPIPTATQNATVSVAVTMNSATDEHSVETDAYATNTTVTTTDATVQPVAVNGGTGFSETSETSTDLVGDSTTTTYGIAALVYAVASPLPFTNTITNPPPSTVQGNLADGTTTSRTYNANGSYTETDTITGGTQNTITVNPDFSGSYNIESASYGNLGFSYSAPASGSVTITETGPTPGTFAVPQWWTGTSLYSDSLVDRGVGALPSPCNPTPTVTSADDFRHTISIVDPVLGYTETETIDAYVVKNFVSTTTVGPACVVIADSQKLYYDYFFDTPFFYFPSFDGGPLQTNTIAEAYWYTSAPTDASVRSQSESPGGIPGLAASIAAHASGIAFTRATERAERIENFVRGVIAGHVGGMK
jgi:hypothetical protein